jgi:FKBP-type peptidyl-prolyl cis-trans isomerase
MFFSPFSPAARGGVLREKKYMTINLRPNRLQKRIRYVTVVPFLCSFQFSRKEIFMRILMQCLLIFLLTSGQALAEEKKQVELTTDIQKLSYALGLDLGSYFKSLGEDLDLTILHQGVLDAYQGAKPLLSEEEAAEIQQVFVQKQQEERLKQTLEMITKNKEAAEDFLKENGAREGVVTTESGLQYKILTQGDGPKPKAEDTVKVHYKGTLLDGSEFDSSYSRGEPAVFPLNQVIPGWTEALQLLNAGSKAQIFLPPDLAYGDRGAPPVIEPGSMLIFEVELLGIENETAGEEPVK